MYPGRDHKTGMTPDAEKCHPAERRPARQRPTNAAEHKSEALRCIEMSFGPFAKYVDYMARARHHVEAAMILTKLEQLP